MNHLKPINSTEDIPRKYQNTPIGDLFAFHNFNTSHPPYTNAKMLIGMCIDHRAQLNIPHNFAYVLRSPGANFDQDAFAISYAVAVGAVQHIALIGHTNCGMVNLAAKKEKYINGLENAGWGGDSTKEMFESNLADYGLENEIDILNRQTSQFREKFKNVITVPMIYRVEDRKIYLIE